MSTSLPGDTPANRSHRQAKGKAKKTRGISGLTSSTPFAQYDPDTHSWKTCEGTSLSDSETFSPTLPAAGILRNGRLSQRPRLAPRTVATASSSWPTPRSSAAMGEEISQIQKRLADGAPYKAELEEAVALWPNPDGEVFGGGRRGWRRALADARARSIRNGTISEARGAKMAFRQGRHGKLNPEWVGWLN
jgi:hypothetical protein